MKPTPKPTTPAVNFDAIPAELAALLQWVLWRYDWIDERGEWAKVPYNPRTRLQAKTTDPATWGTLEAARTAYQSGRGSFAGVGLVFAAGGDLTGVDLDGCINPETGEVSDWAQPWLDAFVTYQEVSPSGTGVKLFCRATKPDGAGCKKALPFAPVGGKDAAVEAYDRARFFTVTGRTFGKARPITECQGAVDALCNEYFAPNKTTAAKPRTDTAPLPVDDSELLRRAFAAKNGPEVFALYSGDTSAYNGDQSAADMALCSHLVFWSGGDAARLDRWFRSSALYRDKWDEQRGAQTYGQRTLEKALTGCSEFYNPSSFVGNSFNSFNLLQGSLKGGSGGEGTIREEGVNSKDPLQSNKLKILNKSEGVPATQPSDPWEGEPLPFGNENLPPFPLSALPPVLADFAQWVAASVGTAVDLPAVQVLAAVAAAAQKRVAVLGKPGHVEPLTLWCVSVAPPGSRKSAIVGAVRKPFAAWEARENESRAPLIDEYQSRERVVKKRLDKAEATAANALTLEAETALAGARSELADLKPVRPLRLIADDATPEAIAALLSENEGRLAVFDAEGTTFGHMTGRYSDKVAVEVYLKSHTGESFTQDRAGKERRSVVVRNAALSIACAIQPEVLATLRKKRELTGRAS